VLNFAGAGQTGPARGADLQLEHGYHGVGAMGHAGGLNDLLGADFARRYAGTGIRYVLNHPGVVATSFAGEYDPAGAAQIEQLKVVGKPVAVSVDQIRPFLDPAWTRRLTAVVEGAEVPLAISPADAERLHDLTEKALAALPAAPGPGTTPPL
jgi:hypothetical protein